MDSDIHDKFTGQPNGRILENAALLMNQGVDIIFRQPVVPAINDSIENIEATATFLSGLGKSDVRLELMPYHRMGWSKYKALDMKYPMNGTDAAGNDMVESVKRAYLDRGIRCTVSR